MADLRARVELLRSQHVDRIARCSTALETARETRRALRGERTDRPA
jgi:hypothetical protein